MDKMDKKVTNASGRDAVAADAPPLKVPKDIPAVDSEAVQGACRRSAKARRLHATLQARAEAGKPLAASEVEKLVKASEVGGKPDGDQAVVLAHHAQTDPRVFGGGHHFLLLFLARISWKSLLRDLKTFMMKIREQEADVKKREEIRQSLEKDRIEDDTMRTLRKKTTAATEVLRKDEQKEVLLKDEQLSEDTKLRLTLERLKR